MAVGSHPDHKPPDAVRVAAEGYAQRGWRVLPVDDAKRPVSELVPHGLRDATDDASTLRRWFDGERPYGVAVVVPEGHLVVDVDPRHGGSQTLAELPELPPTLTAVTGGGGTHAWFTIPPGSDLAQRSIGDGVDTRIGGRGYVVAPPTVHASGRAYAWVDSTTPIAPAPAWLLALLEKSPRSETPQAPPPAERLSGYGKRSLERATLALVRAQRGTRNNTLASEAYTLGQLVGGGVLPESEVRATLESAVAGWDAAARAQTRGTLERQLAAGIADPRTPPERVSALGGGSPADDAYEREERAAIAGGDLAPANDQGTASEPAARCPLTIADVLATWRAEGPLVHEPTGVDTLDEMTGGGPVYGSRWYALGAPDAGKTALLIQIADTFARRGIVVGVLAVDEEASDIVTRLAQRAGWKRKDCEERDVDVVSTMAEALGGLPIKLYDDTWSIEAAARDLADVAAATGGRACLVVDSIQAVSSEASARGERDGRELSTRETVTSNVRAFRAAATRYKLLAFATGEMNRGAYRSVLAAEQSDDMASGKESGAIEYSARVMLALRNVKKEPGKIEVRIVKNKHGTLGSFFLEIDRRQMKLAECEAPADTTAVEEAAKEAKHAVRDRRVDEVGERIVAGLLRARKKLTTRNDLRELVRGDTVIADKAITRLQQAGRIEGGRGQPFVVVQGLEGGSESSPP